MRTYSYIKDPAALRRLCASLPRDCVVSLDTEFVRESTYFPRLCLIQIATESELACIDCIELEELSPLFATLFDNSVTCVVHSARQDLEIFWHACSKLPGKLIDTQIAAALLGYAPQIGLQEIVRSILRIELDKTHTRTNWARRPLTENELEYAADDVRYLLDLWDRLRLELRSLGRENWLREDCNRLLAQPLIPDPVALFQRLRGSGSLAGPAIGAALSLIRWREQRAQKVDRPRRWIMADDLLVRLAKRRPGTQAELESVEGIAPRTAAKSGAAILGAIAQAQSRELESLAERIHSREAPDPQRLKALQNRVAELARELGIPAEVIATKRDLAAAVLGRPPAQLIAGWRADVLRLDDTE